MSRHTGTIGGALALVLLVAAVVSPASPAAAATCERWVDPAGSDAHAGTAAAPWKTLEHAADAVPDAGCTVWFRSGIYAGSQQIKRRFATLTTFRAVDPHGAVFLSTSTVVDVDGARNVVLEGFEITHDDSSADGYVVIVDQGDGQWAENVTLRNNIIHDSRDNDLLKIHNGVRHAVVEGNLFFNQADSEQHIDVNSVTDVVIQDNIFFNDYASSGRTDGAEAKHFIVVKDSNEGADGLLGSQRITIRRNVFLNWQGGRETFVKVGNDGKPYHEADTVDVVNNLMIGNSPDEARTPFGVAGARRVTFANNTIVGDLPSSSYGFILETKESNPINEDISFVNNVWADPTGTMGEFSDGDPGATVNAELRNNLYWNGGAPIPAGELLSPLVDDPAPVVDDPRLDDGQVVLPRWLGGGFASGHTSIRSEFLRLVDEHGRPGESSAVIDRADPNRAPADDILGRDRGPSPDLGAFEIDSGTFGPCPSVGTYFDDVVPGRYYSDAVRWLVCEGFTTGTSPTTFSPHDPVTRAQMATFLWRYADQPSPSSPTTPFADIAPGQYYSHSVAWLLETGITTGTSPTTFSPHDPVTRAQMATFLWRYADQPSPSSPTTPFADIAPGQYYSHSVAWLLETGITTGTSPTTFSPHDPVTRAQMATFLWRYADEPLV